MGEPQDKPAPARAPEGLTGKTVGRFVIGERLGAGGMGEVYRAEDTKLQRAVAIKRLAPTLRADERYRRRFLREAVQASALNHPNIAGIYDVLEEGDELLLVMELVKGETLRQFVSAPITLADFLLIAIQCAEALSAAHEKNIVHGDIKPENIMLTGSKQVKVLDFGLAKRAASKDLKGTTEMPDSAGGTFSGTPAYMAPEALLEKRPDGRADIFSLGVVFYEILSNGQHPFVANSLAGTIHQVLQSEPTPLRKANAYVPRELAAMVMKALEKDPARRYATAQQLLEDLEAVERGEPPQFAAGESEPGTARPRRRFALGVAVGIAVLAGALLGGWIWLRSARNATLTPVATSRPTIASLPILINLAVLPIPPTSNDPGFTALGDGLIDSLTDKFCQLTENRTLQVVPASAMRQAAVTTLQEAQQEFGANLGLQITLQKSADKLRATFTLADTKSGRIFTTAVVTSAFAEPMALESQLALSVAKAMNLDLRPEDERVLAGTGSKAAAYAAYLQARGSLHGGERSKGIENAIALFNEALKSDSKFGLAEAGLGEAYWERFLLTRDAQWSSQAETACQSAVDSGNAGAEGHYCLGMIDNGLGRFQDAVDQFQRALQLDPTHDGTYTALAGAYQRLGKADAEEQVYQRAADFRPQYWRAAEILGEFLLAQGNYTKASEMFQRVTDLAPDSYRGYAGLGASLLGAGKFQDSIQPLEKSVAIHGTAEAYTNLGAAHFHLKQYEKSAEHYSKATQSDGSNYQLWGHLADALTFAGRRSDAMNAYNKAISLANGELQRNPDDARLLGALAVFYTMVQNKNAADVRLKQALKAAGKDDKDALFIAAVVRNQFGETDAALDSLNRALQAGLPKDAVRDSPAFDNLRKNPKYIELVGK